MINKDTVLLIDTYWIIVCLEKRLFTKSYSNFNLIIVSFTDCI